MNILMVNRIWHPGGGDWTYIENMSALYQQHGHQIIPFAMHHPDNYPSEYSEYFIKHRDYRELNDGKWYRGLGIAAESIYSFEALSSLKRVRIDLAHLNIIHRYQTPAILKVLKEAGIPIVWTLHDYTILCPEGTFVSNGSICEACKGGKFYRAVQKKCKKQSILASGLACADNYVNQFLNYYSFVDQFICPSKFLYDKYLSYGIHPEKLHQLYHSYDPRQLPPPPENQADKGEKYFVFLGRLEKIKGIHTLLKAMKSCPDIPLKIIGDGTEKNTLMEYAREHHLNQVSFLGNKSKEEIWPILQGASFMVFPSECLEILGFSILEAMLCNKPVIGTKIGAIPETIIDGKTGLLVEACNAEDLAEKIKALYADEQLCEQLGNQAGSYIRALTEPNRYYEHLQKIIPSLS
ncbi:MAG: hypothetical protein RI924_1471 [Bacteroidota bacterium]|jgi:glycosyltransferase involved in cell wall biosynthesis